MILNLPKEIGFFVFVFGFLIFGCSKKTEIGSDLFGEEELEILTTEDFTIHCGTVERPPELVYSGGDQLPAVGSYLVGELNDSYVGFSRSEAFAKLNFATTTAGNPLDSATIDSAVLILRYDTAGVLGVLDQMITLQVFEVDEYIDRNQDYKSDVRFTTVSQPIAEHTFLPTPFDSLYSEPDTSGMVTALSPRLAIPIEVDTMDPDNLINRIRLLDSVYWTGADTFSHRIKGLNFRLKEGQNYNTMLSFFLESSTISQLRIYYKNPSDTSSQTLSFNMGGSNFLSTYYTHSYSGSEVMKYLSNPSAISDSVMFIQQMQGLSPELTISGLSKLSGTLINSAEITVFVQEAEDPPTAHYPLPEVMGLQYKLDSLFLNTVDTQLGIAGASSSGSLSGYYSAFGGKLMNGGDSTQMMYIYTALVTSQLQEAVNRKQDSTTIYISTFFQPDRPRRALLYGSESKHPVKLVVRYTKV